MTDRERNRLIELIDDFAFICPENCKKEIACTLCKAQKLSDYLLANGVIVPPCKVGAKVYVITSKTSDNKNLYIFEDVITHYVVCDNYNLMCFENHLAVANYNWDKVFLTKEEAEEKLKELGK